jgi:hypothetical protein
MPRNRPRGNRFPRVIAGTVPSVTKECGKVAFFTH